MSRVGAGKDFFIAFYEVNFHSHDQVVYTVNYTLKWNVRKVPIYLQP